MSTSPATVRAPAGTKWAWPIDVNRYDRSPELTSAEQLAIRAILKGRMQGRYRRDPCRSSLRRLLDPILDSLHVADAGHTDTGLVVKLLLRHMQRRRCSLWRWTESEWGRLACNTIAGFERMNTVSARSRPYLLAVSVLLLGVRDLRHLGHFDRVGLAKKVFGQPVESSIQRIAETLTAWGYSSDLSRIRERSCLCEVFLLNRSPLLEDISVEILLELHESRLTEERRWNITAHFKCSLRSEPA